MPSDSVTSIPASGASTIERDRAGTRFFFGMSILLMVLVVMGFGRTLYFRPFFDVPPLDGHLYLHGLILTGWYVLLVAQTSLIRTARTATHRRLGMLGAFWALLVVIGGQIASLSMVGRATSLGLDLDMVVGGVSVVRFFSDSVWSGITGQCVFAILVATAILLRKQPETHKRLILLASILAVGPAINRMANWPLLGGSGDAIGIGGPLARAKMLLIVAVVAHDLWKTRRIHPATLAGGAAVLLHQFGYPWSLISGTEFGIAFTRSLQ